LAYFFRKELAMRYLLALIVGLSVGVCTVGCDKKDEHKVTTESTTVEKVDGKVTGEQKTTTETKTAPAPGTDK
jgi:hypothetical protein